MKNGILIIYFFLASANLSFSQCPLTNFTSQDLLCLDEFLDIKNTSSGAISYEWNFCAGSVLNTPTSSLVIQSLTSLNPFALKKIISNGTNYIFVLGRNTNNIVKYDFGQSLSNSPIITRIENIEMGSLLDLPQGFDFVYSNNIWYAVVSNTDGSIILLKFGSSLDNIPTSTNVQGVTPYPDSRGVKIIEDQGNIVSVIATGGTSSHQLSLLNFGNNLESTPLQSTIDIPNANTLTGIDIINDCGNWQVVTAGYFSGLHTLEFGNSILNPTPTIYDINGITFPYTPVIIKEIDSLFVITTSNDNGNLIRSNFGLSLANSTPTITNLGNLGILSNVVGFDLFRDNSIIKGIGIGKSDRKLSLTEFPRTCGSSVESSVEFEPTNIIFDTSGQYYISLKATDGNGVSQSSSKLITVNSSNAPQVKSVTTGNCISNFISFSGQQISGNITAWNWDFGDGVGTSNLQNASYIYGATGEYQVRLNVTDASGCNNLLIDTVQVYEQPIPSFSVPGGNLCMNNEIAFTNISTGETGPAVTWTWNFNGEGSSNEKEPSFTFLTSGSKTITLTASIPGCANVTQQTITIEEAPTTSFSFNNTCNTQTTTFTDATTGSNLTTWNWDFGDGNNSTTQSPTHTYAAAGKYVVTLSVSNNLGCTTTKVDTVFNHDIPVVNFTNDLACSTSPIQFTDQSLVSNTNLVAWEWDFGDGSTSTDQHPTHLYNQTGDFTVKLKAHSQFGCVDSTQTIISVAQGPQVDFEWDKACQGEATTFTDLTNSFGVPITNWNWIVNGTLLTNQNPTYIFSSSGTYTVQLSVTVNNLCAQTMSQDIIIEIPPTVQFDYSEGCGGTGTSFYDLTDQSDDPIITREWRVDGSKISTDSVATTQLDPGTYAITLSVITVAGCEETTTSNVSLIGSPVAAFEVNTIYGATPLQIEFSNLSTGGGTYGWDFGDSENTTSTDQNPTFTYNEIGIYAITLRTYSNPSCYDETTQQIEVVNAESSAEIIAITLSTTNDITNFVITIENTGTNIINNTSNLVFRADYGTEVIEPINAIIYAGKTVNYSTSYAIASSSNTSAICVELIDSQKTQLDRSCININSTIHISEPYPNPTQGLITVDVTLANSSSINIRVLNRSGQPMLTKSFDGITGLNNFLIDAQGLPQGLYIIEVTAGNKTEQFKTSISR